MSGEFFLKTHDHSKKLDIFWATLIFLPVKENSGVVSNNGYNTTYVYVVVHTYIIILEHTHAHSDIVIFTIIIIPCTR